MPVDKKRFQIAADITFLVHMKNTYDMNYETKSKKKECSEKIKELLAEGGFETANQAIKYRREHKTKLYR